MWYARPKTLFFFENVENIGKVKSGIRNYFRSPKIIFEKKPIFGLTQSGTPFMQRKPEFVKPTGYISVHALYLTTY